MVSSEVGSLANPGLQSTETGPSVSRPTFCPRGRGGSPSGGRGRQTGSPSAGAAAVTLVLCGARGGVRAGVCGLQSPCSALELFFLEGLGSPWWSLFVRRGSPRLVSRGSPRLVPQGSPRLVSPAADHTLTAAHGPPRGCNATACAWPEGNRPGSSGPGDGGGDGDEARPPSRGGGWGWAATRPSARDPEEAGETCPRHPPASCGGDWETALLTTGTRKTVVGWSGGWGQPSRRRG